MTTKIPAELSSTPGISDSSNATAITIDSSEKVGLNGLSAGDYWSSSNQLVLGNTTSAANGGLTIATANDATGQIYFADGTSGDARYRGQIQYTHVSDAMDFQTAASFRMRIDSVGRVGIGTSSPDAMLKVVSNSNSYAASWIRGDQFGLRVSAGSTSSHYPLRIANASDTTLATFNGDGNVGINTSSPSVKLEIQEAVASTYTARFMHTGNPNSGPPQLLKLEFYNTPNNGTSEFIKCRDTISGTAVSRAVLMSNGGLANYQSNNANLSDEREKKNITNADNQLDNIKSLSIKSFHYNEDADSDDKRLGIIAQDIESSLPNLVTDFNKSDTEIRKGVKEQQIMWMAVKAIQEQQDIIDDLKSRIETLEG